MSIKRQIADSGGEERVRREEEASRRFSLGCWSLSAGLRFFVFFFLQDGYSGPLF